MPLIASKDQSAEEKKKRLQCAADKRIHIAATMQRVTPRRACPIFIEIVLPRGASAAARELRKSYTPFH